MDDGTFLHMDPASVPWGVLSGPIQPGRSYTVLYPMDLLPSGWSELTGAARHNEVGYRYLTDEGAGGPRKFYRVRIEKSGP